MTKNVTDYIFTPGVPPPPIAGLADATHNPKLLSAIRSTSFYENHPIRPPCNRPRPAWHNLFSACLQKKQQHHFRCGRLYAIGSAGGQPGRNECEQCICNKHLSTSDAV